MYLRTTRARDREYVQLAHNQRDAVSGQSRPKILHNFGPKDELDVKALERLVVSISRFLDPEEASRIKESLGLEPPFEFLGAKRFGGSYLLDGIWRRLNIDQELKKLLSRRSFRSDVERLLFALVARAALAPDSKLSLESWIADEAYVEGLAEVEVQQLYRAMDFLLEAHDAIQKEVFFSIRNLFNLEVDVIFVDTTTSYFEIEGEDGEEGEGEDALAGEGDDGGRRHSSDVDEDGDAGGTRASDDRRQANADEESNGGLRRRGRSQDKRGDLAQVVIGFAVTRSGIPVRCWVWPGNAADANLVEEVKRDLNTWKLGNVIMVLDTGFNSERNRRILQGAGDHYIIGERMRLGPDGKLPEALKRAGRYQTLANGLKIKEVVTNKESVVSRRFVIVHNPKEAERDRHKREDIVRETKRRLEKLGEVTGDEHTKAACSLVAHPTFGRFVKKTKTGKLTLDRAKIEREAKLDGKFLLSTSDQGLSAEDVALGYKQLAEIERVNRDLKHTACVRPVRHRREDRIRSHVLLCWLALLLIRIAENESGETWHQLKKIFRPLSVGFHQSRHGAIVQTNPLTGDQKRVLKALALKQPKRYLEIPTPKKPKAA